METFLRRFEGLEFKWSWRQQRKVPADMETRFSKLVGIGIAIGIAIVLVNQSLVLSL